MKLRQILRVAVLATGLGISFLAKADELAPAAAQLAQTLDGMHVEQLWLAGRQVDWRTGEPNGKIYTNALSHTHCSAFAAAAAEKLGVYLLRPPEHSSVLLANAQQAWLCGDGTNEGWQAVKSPLLAQKLANEGQLVVVTCKNPDDKKPGHIAIVRPSQWTEAKILADGPEITQAGAHNHISTTTREGFKNHPGAFENDQLLYFAHPVPPKSSPKLTQRTAMNSASEPKSAP